MSRLGNAVVLIVIAGFIFGGFTTMVSGQYGASGITIRGMINREILKQSLPKRRSAGRTGKSSTPDASIRSNLINQKPVGKTPFQMGQLIIPNKVYQNSNGSEQERRRSYESLKAHWDNYENVANKDGFPAYDLAYALEYYLVTNYLAYSDYYDPKKSSKRNGESDQMHQQRTNTVITIPIEEKIYWQFKNYLENNNYLNNLSNQDKQMLAETLVITTGVPWQIYKANYANYGSEKLRARKMAEGNLQNLLGVSPEKLIIFEEGFTLLP